MAKTTKRRKRRAPKIARRSPIVGGLPGVRHGRAPIPGTGPDGQGWGAMGAMRLPKVRRGG